jgi:hypothetical protein
MFAYQVFKGDCNKHGNQIYELVATYLDIEKAISHCNQIVSSTPLYGDELEEGDYVNNNLIVRYWDAVGWERLTICEMRTIQITQ